jgi:hypothetical protein
MTTISYTLPTMAVLILKKHPGLIQKSLQFSGAKHNNWLRIGTSWLVPVANHLSLWCFASSAMEITMGQPRIPEVNG